jgi:hypothetical protein
MVRAAIQGFFVLVYLASSYTTAYSRVLDVVDELQHSGERPDGVVLDDGCKEYQQYAHFREAKKTGELYSQQSQLRTGFQPSYTAHDFVCLIASPHSCRIDNDHTRGPPQPR